MPLLVVSYPGLAEHDLAWIVAAKREHNRLETSILAPHFTIVFPTTHIQQDVLVDYLAERLDGQSRIKFSLRSAIVVPDDSSERYYVQLVPDEGFSKIVKLHDSLYTGPLANLLRLDIPYIPHITLGYANDPLYCKDTADSLNGASFEINGEIRSLDVVAKEGSSAHTVKRFCF